MGATCKSCGAEILWVKTEMGNWMPVDRACHPAGHLVVNHAERTVIAVDPMTTEYKGILHRSHFSTCPDADEHRQDAAARVGGDQ